MQNFISRCLNEGARRVTVSGPIPQLPHRNWEPGCLIQIPVELEILAYNMNSSTVLFVGVETIFADGYRQYDKLFLSQLTRWVRREDGSITFAKGTVPAMIRSCSDWSEALQCLAGKTIKVISDEVVEVVSPKGEFFRNRHIYSFDFA